MELPTPPQTVESSEASRLAKRRRVQDSSSGSDISVVSRSSTGAYTAERFRVGIPALQLLPLLETEASSTLPAVSKFRELLPRIEQVLHDREIEFEEESVELMHRNIPDEEVSGEDLTVLIPAQWNDDNDGQTWLLAAEDIRTVLLSSFLTRRVKVELLSWQLTTPRTMSALESEHPLVGSWSTLNPRIHIILDENLKLGEAWKSIDVIRLGYVREDYQDFPVTIAITVDWSLDRRDWALAERQIQDILREVELDDVEVEFERGDVFPITFPTKKPTRSAVPDRNDVHEEDYSQRVPMGSDFGPEKYFSTGADGSHVNGPCATIGGYLEVLQSDSTYKKFVFTNYHCVREVLKGFAYTDGPKTSVIKAEVPANSELDKIDKNGIGPSYDRSEMNFESPSRRKHNFTLQWHDEEIQTLSVELQSKPSLQGLRTMIDDHQTRRARKVQFFDEERHKYGQLWMCSGLRQRTKENGRLDIALIEVKSTRMGDNTIPDVSAWPRRDEAPTPACGKLLEGLRSCKDIGKLSAVFKVGSATGSTRGRFNGIKSDVRMEWDKRLGIKEYSTEYCFVAGGNLPLRPFTSHGDSGSLVFDIGGQWLGCAFGGSTKRDVSKALNYVTDAQAILDWINEKRGDVSAARLATT